MLTVFLLPPARLRENLLFVSSKMWLSDSCVNILKESRSAGIYIIRSIIPCHHIHSENSHGFHIVCIQAVLFFLSSSVIEKLVNLLGNQLGWAECTSVFSVMSAPRLHSSAVRQQTAGKHLSSCLWLRFDSVQTFTWTEKKRKKKKDRMSLKGDSADTPHQPGSIMISALLKKCLSSNTKKAWICSQKYLFLFF